MVDYCMPINNGQIFVIPSLFQQEKPTSAVHRTENYEGLPLNLSIKNKADTSGRRRLHFNPVDHEYSRQQYADENSNQNNQNNIIIQETAAPHGQEFGNLLIVSNINSDVVQEEVVETHEHLNTPQVLVDNNIELVIDTKPNSAFEIECREGQGNGDDDVILFCNSTEEIVAEESKYVNDLIFEESRNTILKTKYNSLLEQVKRLREYLDNEAKKERSLQMGDIENKKQQTSSETTTRICPVSSLPKVSSHLSSSSSDFDNKSEGDVSESNQSSENKRSRYNSWPQMSTLSSSQRKKEQNKLASKRFRERKKQEMERAQTEIMELEVRNSLLRKQETCILSEIENLKKYMLDQNLIKIVDLPSGLTNNQLKN